jgi:hypothetical protein
MTRPYDPRSKRKPRTLVLSLSAPEIEAVARALDCARLWHDDPHEYPESVETMLDDVAVVIKKLRTAYREASLSLEQLAKNQLESQRAMEEFEKRRTKFFRGKLD